MRRSDPAGKSPEFTCLYWKIGRFSSQIRFKTTGNGHAPLCCRRGIGRNAYGALKFSDHPRAKVLSMDLSEAGAHPGVERIFTAEDIPGARHTGLIVQDWPLMIRIEKPDTSAMCWQLSSQIPRKCKGGGSKINVDYEVLTPVTDPKAALESSKSWRFMPKETCFRMRKSIVVISNPHAKKVLTSPRGPTPPNGSNTPSWKWNVVLRHLQRMASKSIHRVRVFMRIGRASVESWDFLRKRFV